MDTTVASNRASMRVRIRLLKPQTTSTAVIVSTVQATASPPLRAYATVFSPCSHTLSDFLTETATPYIHTAENYFTW